MAKKKTLKEKLLGLAKIEKLPKTVSETLPFKGMTASGIIETSPGHFTKSYHLTDVNFQMAPIAEQARIFAAFEEFLNSFSENVTWEFTIFNHKIDKFQTLENIRIAPRSDGLNPLRKEMNEVLVNKLCEGNNSVTQDKYLTVMVEDSDFDHAAETLRRIDVQVANGIEKITGKPVSPMTTLERIKLLYNIYNQDYDYRLPLIEDTSEAAEGDLTPTLSKLSSLGISVRDVIGPSGINFGHRDYFMLGDMYARVLYLKDVPTQLTSEFIADLGNLQCNLLISTTAESLDQGTASKMVSNKVAELRGEAAARVKSNMDAGYFTTDTSPALQDAINGAQELLKDITNHNQKIIFQTLTLTLFAETKLQLDDFTGQAMAIAKGTMSSLKTLQAQQEFGFNTCLPLCRNDVFVDRLYTSETASIFLPFKSQEINQRNAVFYGLNQTTRNMILYDRMSGPNYNGLIFGAAGSGKSFIAKCEMISKYLNSTQDQFFVTDPQGEYTPIARALNGTVIRLATGSDEYLNPLDLDLSGDERDSFDPIATKSAFVMAMLDFMAGSQTINPAAKSIVDRCVRHIYRPYIEAMSRRQDGCTCDPSIAPTLGDLYNELKLQENELADEVNAYLEGYAVGSFKTFARRTNIRTRARFVVYNIKDLSTGMRPLGLHICLNSVWSAMAENYRKGIVTHFYIDEFHLLLSTPSSAKFMQEMYKMARKWKGALTGITQNTEELLATPEAKGIFNNTSFIIMMYLPEQDRQNLQQLLSLSDALLKYISTPHPGHGLIYTGSFVLPFAYDFPKNTELFRIMQTTDVGAAV